jgi:hypothetical protein
MERLGREYAPIVEGIGCSNNHHRKQSWSPIFMTDTILATGNTVTVGTEEVVRQLSEKDINFLKSGAFSKVALTLEETVWGGEKQANDSAQVCRGLCREGV